MQKWNVMLKNIDTGSIIKICEYESLKDAENDIKYRIAGDRYKEKEISTKRKFYIAGETIINER